MCKAKFRSGYEALSWWYFVFSGGGLISLELAGRKVVTLRFVKGNLFRVLVKRIRVRIDSIWNGELVILISGIVD